ncbi:DUF488 domain-containing protein [Nocardia donostiensis]|uniref:MarR family transcriptional regulator n=1 Tax=Nocardia donostiensis TaxID=1538463 RepID=A0A1W0BDQ2_9NOCA|nr:DUF488 family protein [Nocardia donostiensis]ONM50614.1 MarR family transcriptional regulator [Nocardia donostiensis]OQS20742.1 MarR family transcriptional regulator [Nocardia donostiensis]
MTDDSLTPPRGFRLKRVYDDPDPDDGYRVLVDRLWPRGLKKVEAHIDEWAKDVAPSTELRRWFHEDPEGRRGEFAERYADELSGPAARQELGRLRELAANEPPVTLLTAVKEPERGHLPILLGHLRG